MTDEIQTPRDRLAKLVQQLQGLASDLAEAADDVLGELDPPASPPASEAD